MDISRRELEAWHGIKDEAEDRDGDDGVVEGKQRQNRWYLPTQSLERAWCGIQETARILMMTLKSRRQRKARVLIVKLKSRIKAPTFQEEDSNEGYGS